MVHIHGILEKAKGKHIGGGQGLESGKEMTTKGHRGIFEGNRNLYILTLPVAALLNAFACLFFFVCLLVWFGFFWPHRVAYEILVPQPGIEPSPPAAEAQSLNPWISRQVLECIC